MMMMMLNIFDVEFFFELQSHILALRTAIRENDENQSILICEDDCELINKKLLCEKIKSIDLLNWDCIILAHNTITSESINQDITKIISSQTGSCYLIKVSYAKKLLNIFERDFWEYCRTGEWKSIYCNDQSWKELQDKDNWFTLDLEPRMAKQRESYSESYSDIQKVIVNYNVYKKMKNEFYHRFNEDHN
jgi:GR25 family glycosyltransferase involved in LPS biosynthesis